MRIPRLRVLRHWSGAERRGMWLFLVEPRWPIFQFQYESWEDELKEIFPLKESDSLDFVLEHFDRTVEHSGDCKETIWAYDVFDLTKYLFK